MMQIASETVAALATDPHLQAQLQADPVGTLNRIAMPLQTDTWIYRGVVFFLGITVVFTVMGSIVLSIYGKPMSEGLIALGATSVGAMAGLLAPSPGR